MKIDRLGAPPDSFSHSWEPKQKTQIQDECMKQIDVQCHMHPDDSTNQECYVHSQYKKKLKIQQAV